MSRATPPAQGAPGSLVSTANDIINQLNRRFALFGEIVISPEEQSALRSASGTPSTVASPNSQVAPGAVTTPTALQPRQTP